MYNVLYMLKDHKKMIMKLGDIATAIFLLWMYALALADSVR
jgi:hypothetical protein